jgi:hypothetical protein
MYTRAAACTWEYDISLCKRAVFLPDGLTAILSGVRKNFRLRWTLPSSSLVHIESVHHPESPEENVEFSLPSPGVLFAEARREKGLALEHIARNTRISVHNLLALEDDRYQDLPADTFVRGYLKMLAREIEQDENLWLAAYDDIVNTDSSPEQRSEAPWSGITRTFSLESIGLPFRVGHVLAIILAIMGFFLFYFALEGGTAKEDAAAVQPEGALIERLDLRPVQNR